MKYSFEINIFPKNTEGYHIPSFTEGQLRIIIGHDQEYLNASGILLVEYAIVLAKWLEGLKTDPEKDLFYSSMDFEEEPIFALRYNKYMEKYELLSVWAKEPCQEYISKVEAVAAGKDYLNELEHVLRIRFGVSLNRIIKNALSEE